MQELIPIIENLANGKQLSEEEAKTLFSAMLEGKTSTTQVAATLMALRVRGETLLEIQCMCEVMRHYMVKVELDKDAIDIVGTGGDGLHTYNISTATSLIVASAGVKVAKHGNRSVSSRSGTADVFSLIGVKLDCAPGRLVECFHQCGIGFIFAPAHHQALRHVGPVRKELAVRTIFNMCGPLCNPAGVQRQLVGAYAASKVEPMAKVLTALGTTHSWLVHGNGMDEITNTGDTMVVEIKGEKRQSFTIHPRDFGFPVRHVDELKGGDPQHNYEKLMALFGGEKGAYRDIVLMNAGAALYLSGKVSTPQEGAVLAATCIDQGMAQKKLVQLHDFFLEA